MKDYPSHGMEMPSDVANHIETAVYERDLHYLSAWQEDPLENCENKTIRQQLYEGQLAANPALTLAEKYKCLRFITQELVVAEGRGVFT